MADRASAAEASRVSAQADLSAFFRHKADVPTASAAALIRSLRRLRRSDDPVVAFGSLPEVCVPGFADGCEVELSDSTEPVFRVRLPVSSPDGVSAAVHPAGPAQILTTPFRAASGVGYPSYAGVVTLWWTSRTWSESDAVIADLMANHLIALVDHERLMAALARAEDQAASLALEAISGRAISVATGVVMHEQGVAADDAEDLLRQSAARAGSDLHQLAVSVLRSGSLTAGRATRNGGRRGMPSLAAPRLAAGRNIHSEESHSLE